MKKEEKPFKLIKEYDGEFGYTDQDGFSHSSPEEWLWSILGACGCGSSEDLENKAWKLLQYFATPHQERKIESLESPYNNEVMEVLAHWFDSKGMTEHGSNICSSWLTEKGKQIYESMNNLIKPHAKN